MLGNEKLLFDEFYEKTKDFGRVQFVKLLMTKEKENQELKLELSDYRQAILEDKDMLGLKEESEELKKQLKELEEYSANAINKQVSRGIDLVNQQKEFIEYLEKTIVDSKAGSGQQYYYQQVLEMYKEIIGVSK